MTTITYQSSKGPKAIADLPYPYLVNAHAKLVREDPSRVAEIEAMAARIAELDAAHALAAAEGSNLPPEPIVTEPPTVAAETPNPPALSEQLATLTTHFDDLLTEAKNWADGTPIETPEQAAEVDRLIDQVKAAITGAEAARDEWIAPLNAEIKTVREAFYPLIGETKAITGVGVKMKTALLAVKTEWGRKVAAENAAKAEALRKEALAKAQEAAQAAQASAGNIEAADVAEALIREAKATLTQATQAEKATPGKGYRTVTRVTMTNRTEAIRTMWRAYPEEFVALAQKLAERRVREGHKAIPGFSVIEEKVAI